MTGEVWHIVIVDASTGDRADVRRLLLEGSDRRYAFTEAETAAAGLRALRECAAAPQRCVLLSCHLPDMPAPAFIAAVNGSAGAPGWPVVVVTGDDSAASGRNALRAGAHDCVGKDGLTAQVLRRAVENASERWAMADERRQQQATAHASTQHFQALVRATSDIVYRMSADWSLMHPLDGRALVPSTDTPLAGWAWLHRNVPADEHARVRQAIGDAIARKALFSLEHRVLRPDGAIGWALSRAVPMLDAQGTVLEWFGAASDITERRQAQERLRLAVAGSDLGTWHWDVRTGALDWSERCLEIFGLPARTAMSYEKFIGALHPDDRARADEAVQGALQGGSDYRIELRSVWPDGSVHWLASRATPVAELDGRILRYIGVNWDVTARVNAEAARQESLIAQRKSEAKSEFLARMSHELRTPLNAVLGFAQLLQIDHDRGAPAQRAHIDHVRSAGEHLLSLINDVLDLSSLESGQLRFELAPVRVADVVAEVLPMMQPLARQHGIAVHADAISGSVRVDRTRLRQILINLLSNAIKYNRPEGEVRVSTRRDGDALLLCVSDTGRGLSAAQIDQLFEPFNRLGMASENIEGTGIGLAIVKALVDRMQGSIRVTSAVGQGSAFEVRLPVDGLDAPVVDTTAARKGSILYIEDNPVNVLLVEELIASRDDLAIVSVGTGAEGVSQARALLPDLVLVDMQLPDFDGFEVLRRLRAQPDTAELTCIALSANAMPEDIALALKAGFSDYWTKPINLRAFLASLAAVFPPREG